MHITSQEFEKIEKRVPQKYRHNPKEFYKILNLALIHPVFEVAIQNCVNDKTIYWWLKSIYKERYQEILAVPRIKLLNPEPCKRIPMENTDQYFSRIEREMKKLQDTCCGNMIVKCSLCGFIYGSEMNLPREMTLCELQSRHIKIPHASKKLLINQLL